MTVIPSAEYPWYCVIHVMNVSYAIGSAIPKIRYSTSVPRIVLTIMYNHICTIILVPSYWYHPIGTIIFAPRVLAYSCNPATWRSRSDSWWDECDVY